jgi:hypothetical protein
MINPRIVLTTCLCGWLPFLMYAEAPAIELDERFQRLETQQRIETEELQSQIVTLIERIDADDRDTRRRAVAELVFYADDSRVIERLLAMLADNGGAALSTEGRINAMYVLLQTAPESWTDPLLERANGVLEILVERHLPSAGPQQRNYIEDLTEHVRRVEAARAPAVGYGVVQERTAKTTSLVDVDVFVCRGTESLEPAYELARLLADRDFGRVRLRELTPEMGLDFEGMGGHTTAFFDAKHPEEKEVMRVESAAKEIEGLPPFRAEPNRGAPSYWYLSVFVCP